METKKIKIGEKEIEEILNGKIEVCWDEDCGCDIVSMRWEIIKGNMRSGIDDRLECDYTTDVCYCAREAWYKDELIAWKVFGESLEFAKYVQFDESVGEYEINELRYYLNDILNIKENEASNDNHSRKIRESLIEYLTEIEKEGYILAVDGNTCIIISPNYSDNEYDYDIVTPEEWADNYIIVDNGYKRDYNYFRLID